MAVKVTGETTVQWEVLLLDEDGDAYEDNVVREKALESFDIAWDLIQASGVEDEKAKCSVTGTTDRILKIRPAKEG